ncbi:MAG: hypothetical protein M1814_000549 [Vezdaea aestivalis]|nr:MAG: hypothetical protein M1814_000549 [Vezdaea aestivalis]
MYQRIFGYLLHASLSLSSLHRCSGGHDQVIHQVIGTRDYLSDDLISRDVVIIGGGAAGSYAAVQLKDMGTNIIVVEQNSRLGGHTHTYHDPDTGTANELGVVLWHNWSLVRQFFAKLGVPLARVEPKDLSNGTKQTFVDFQTGKVLPNMSFPDYTDAIRGYTLQLLKYPYLKTGFHLPDPIPDDLLLSFGDFVEKYALEDIVSLVFMYAQGLGNILEQPTLYVFQNFGLEVLQSFVFDGFVRSAKGDNSEIYEQAENYLGNDVLLGTSIVSTKRSTTGGVEALVQSPSGPKVIRAAKMLSTVPPIPGNLAGWDLSSEEQRLFEKFGNTAFHTGIICNTGLPSNRTVRNFAPDTKYNLPPLPGIYSIAPTKTQGCFRVLIGGPSALLDADVENLIIGSVKRLQTAGVYNTTQPEIRILSSHSPFELTVPVEAIKGGFYKSLYGLQGQRQTYYSGAAFFTHDSTCIWDFTHSLLLRIVADLRSEQAFRGL